MRQLHVLIIAGFAATLIMSQPPTAHAKKPDIKAIKQAFVASQWKAPVTTMAPVYPADTWYTQFQDAKLTQLIEEALANNPSLEVIDSRIDQAEAQAKLSRSPLFPQLNVSGDYLWQQYSQRQFIFPIGARTYHSFSTPLRATYAVDLWGKNILGAKVGKRGLDIAKLDYEASRTQLITSVCASYVNVLKFNALTSVQQQLLDISKKQMFHTQQLYDNGLSTVQDLDNARQQLAQAESEFALVNANKTLVHNQLLVLLGQSPNEANVKTTGSLDALVLPARPEAGIPSEFLTHRPDVAMAEKQLEIAKLNVSIARKEFLPTINITGQSGYNAIGLRNVFQWNSLSSFLNPNVSLPLFQGGALTANLKLKKAEQREAVANYRLTIINAFQDVENSLALLNAGQEIYRNVETQVAATQRQSAEQERRVTEGLDAEPTWLPYESRRLEFEKARIQQKAQIILDYTGVIKALGGGF